MKVCETCIALGYSERVSHDRRIRVLCDRCLGVGSLSLGFESEARWRTLREQAIQRAVRDGWYEDVWAGEPGQAKRVLRLVADTRTEAKTA